MPLGWSSSLCLDVCYQSHIDYTEITVPAGSQQDFHYYFYTNGTPAYGHARVGLRNAEQYSNGFMMNFHAYSEEATVIHEQDTPALRVWPNPANGIVEISAPFDHDRILVQDMLGRTVFDTGRQQTIDLGHLTPGTYLLHLSNRGLTSTRPLKLQLR